MSFDPDVLQDYLLLDGLESFTLTQGSGSPVSVNNCLRETLSDADTLALSRSGLGIQPGTLVLNLWGPELPSGIVPAEGDSLTDAASVGYTVQSRGNYSPLLQRHRLILRPKAIA